MKRILYIILSVLAFSTQAQNVIRPKFEGPGGLWVNTYNGILFFERCDAAVVNSAMPLRVSFYYNSSSVNNDYGYGIGFSLGYEKRYSLDEEGNVFLDIIVMRKDLLERIITENQARGKVSFTQEVLQGQKDHLRIFAYDFKGYIGDIKSIEAYYKCSMDLLNKEVRDQLFPVGRPIYTRVRDEVPVRYGVEAKAKNSMIADGCIIEGEVENSIIFRGVKIGKGAKVKNCILMQGTIVGENAELDCVIADKNVIIRNSRTLTGCDTYPIVIGKGRNV